jgi:hypothetical protein
MQNIEATEDRFIFLPEGEMLPTESQNINRSEAARQVGAVSPMSELFIGVVISAILP